MKKKTLSNWSKEELIDEILKLHKRKKFGIVWQDKIEEIVEFSKKNIPILEELKNKEIKTDNKRFNLIIEGDNYNSLQLLSYTHSKKIDIIYIDPPYNTGAKDWKYNNDFVDELDSFRHSKWLSMMNNRLKIAKKLLKKDGVLICSIDENEKNQLGVLLEEIFYEYEIHCISIVHNPGGVQGKNFSYNNEFAFFIFPKNIKKISLENREEDPDIRPLRDVSTGNHLRTDAKNCFFPIYVKNNKVIGFGKVCEDSFHPKSPNIKRKDGILEIYPIDTNGNERKWVFARQTIDNIKDELFVEFNKKRKIFDIIRKKTKFNYKTVWNKKSFNANLFGTQLLRSIIKTSFPFPKSMYLVKEFIQSIIHQKDAIILDFFAGSGTTGQAVLEINKEDSGNRQFILCTNNENNIASEVTFPRISKNIKGYTNLKNKKKVNGLGGNLKYYKIKFFNQIQSDADIANISNKIDEIICLKEETFNLKINRKKYKIFNNSHKTTIIIYDDTVLENLDEIITNTKVLTKIYIFSLGTDTYEEYFNKYNNVEVIPLPNSYIKSFNLINKLI